MENLTKETFVEKVFDYENNEEWNFKGDKPAIIDFYADWCGPCKMVGPVLEDISKDYEGKIDVYKIDTEDQHELAVTFGIRSIPSILFIPLDDTPQMSMGAMPKEAFEDAIHQIFDIEKEDK